MINLIVNVTVYKNKLAIGRNEKLLFRLKDDLLFFKNITTNSLSKDSNINKNIVLMGRKTYDSIPIKNKPLSGRINLVLTKNKKLIKENAVPSNGIFNKELYYLDFITFEKLYKKYNPNIFVIGGSEIYNYFLEHTTLKPQKLYITNVQTINNTNIKFEKDTEPNIFMNNFDNYYKLIGFSKKYIIENISYRVLYYNLMKESSEEFKYINYMQNILDNGNIREDRTETGTISVFGNQMRFDISQSIPLMTTKKIPFKTIVEELLWMCRGDTDAKILQKRGVYIWDSNTSREFLDKQNLQHYSEGILGAGYGFQWRHFGAKYSPIFADTSKYDTNLIAGFDQLKYIEDLLKNDPFSRRMVISSWNPPDFKNTSLLPCHYSIQFYVTEEKGEQYLSCMFVMRSSDQLAITWNCTAYSLLTYILAKKYNMKPKQLIYVSGDGHIYKNHIDAVKQQLSRIPRPFPKVMLNESIKTKDWKDIVFEDFDLIGYFPFTGIKMPMAI